MAQQQQYGTTPPISVAGPTDAEMTINNEMIQELKRQGTFESQAESDLRVKVLNELQKLASEFVTKVGISKNMPPQVAKESGGKIFTYGSYRLGVYGPGSDIDSLVVAPRHVQRDDFFAVFEPLLRARTEVTELAAVPDAFVPIIKMKFSGISIDLIFARLSLPAVPLDLELTDNNLLRNLTETDVRSLNGTRVTDEILRVVPNANVFKHALRSIKLWAQRRAIYSNVMGFPGGVAWAMLVARICQLYPNAVSCVIVAKFFRILGQWNWPQPVLLKNIEDGPLQVRVWNPKLYHGDKSHRMPIITPAYPSMCATHNICASTHTVILQEMSRAGDIMDKIMLGGLPWSNLFAKHDFFHRYKNYLCIVAASRTAETQLKWSGLVESKVRQLVMRLEISNPIKLAHPYVKTFDAVNFCDTEEEMDRVAMGELAAAAKVVHADLQEVAKQDGKVEDAPPEAEAKKQIFTTRYYVGIDIDKSDATKKLDITWAAQEFTEKCHEWTAYAEEDMSVHLKHLRNYDLPDEVFDETEQRPQREKKTKKRKADVNDAYAAAAKRAT